MRSSPLITCPACGYTFRNEVLSPKKKKLACPMCNYQFKDPDFPSNKLDEFLV
ncbi:MAG: hypothetical protein ACXABG_05475 [Promethearchaeota archaeon]